MFADDVQIETSIHPQHINSAIFCVEICIFDVIYWMNENKLQLNDEKTKCLLIRQNKCSENFNCTSLSFGRNVMSSPTTANKRIPFNR